MTTRRTPLTDDQIEALLLARSVDADGALVDHILAATGRLPQRRRGWLPPELDRRTLSLITAALLLAALAGAMALAGRYVLPDLDLDPPPPGPASAPMFWQGPVRSDLGQPLDPPPRASRDPSMERQAWADPVDSTIGWADIIELSITESPAGSTSPMWHLTVAADAPPTAHLAQKFTITSYGLVFDTTGDGEADIVVGLSNEGLRPGDYRAWLTDLTTGETDDRVGPPDGLPFDFVHPDDVGGDLSRRQVSFFSIRTPSGEITRATPFYGWALVTRGEAIAWDYAPDGHWLQPSPMADDDGN
jgi:hypothetical protein